MLLIGPNGAGKTTLMSCILGDKKASSGQVFIKGKREKLKIKLRSFSRKYHSLAIESQGTDCFFSKIFPDNGLSKVEIQALLQFKDDQYQQFADKLSGGTKRLLAFCSMSNWQA